MHRYLAFGLFSAVVGAATISACDGDSSTSGPGGSGGTGGTGSTGTTTTSSSVVTTSTGTGTFDCSKKVLDQDTCGTCVESKCCNELSLCLQDEGCAFCYLSSSINQMLCNENTLYVDIAACEENTCVTECFAPCDAPSAAPSNGSCFNPPAGQCNPISNVGCGPGSECGFDGQGAFACFTPGENGVCAECGDSGGCQAGMVCASGICTNYCCDAGDCGSGTCLKGVFPDPNLGVCLAGPPKVSCEGSAPDGTCNPAKETCYCADCEAAAFCNPGQCKTDGACTVDDLCVCPDCDGSSMCSCNYDLACDPSTEGCTCSDCWDDPECADNPKEPCTDDGTCAGGEFCTCLDCKDTAFCLDPNHCANDAMCAPYEGCVCDDCMTEPTCQ